MRRMLPLILLACLLAGCSIIRNPANYQASIDLWHDATVAQVPLLKSEVTRLREAGATADCLGVADTLVFAQYWAPYQRELDLAAAQLGEVTIEKPSNVPTPAMLCGKVE